MLRIAISLARPKKFKLLTPKFVVWCSVQIPLCAGAPRLSWMNQPKVSPKAKRDFFSSRIFCELSKEGSFLGYTKVSAQGVRSNAGRKLPSM